MRAPLPPPESVHATDPQQLECTTRKSNPWVELGVMLVQGELSEGVLARIQALNITVNYVEPLSYPNKYNER
mgnify:CR=1 FL=1